MREYKKRKELLTLSLLSSENNLRICPLCISQVQEKEIVVSYIDDVYGGYLKYRHVHLDCWLSRQEPKLVKRFLTKRCFEKLKYKRLLLDM